MTSGRGLWAEEPAGKPFPGWWRGEDAGFLARRSGLGAGRHWSPAASSEEAGEPGAASAEAGLEHGPLDGRQALNSRSVVWVASR